MGIKITAVGDLHFGNPRINPERLYQKLKKYLYPEILKSDLVFITGDTYDQLTTVSSSANKYVAMFIRDLFTMSRKLGIQIRVLHGTYTHDRDQVVIFNSFMSDGIEAKVIDEIFCEEIEVKNDQGDTPAQKLKVLYLPDNLPYKKSEDVIEHIRKVMRVIGWDKVDVMLGHGTFDHALNCAPEHLPPCTYTLQQFAEFVPSDGLIVMGHIHTPSKRQNCYYCGSFERMSHGEEEPKGFFTFDNNSGQWKGTFVEDKEANKFISIRPQGDDPEETIRDYIAQVKDKFPELKGAVRVLHNSSEIRQLLHTITIQQFPDLKYSSKSATDEKMEIKIAGIALDTFDDVKPNVHNLGELVYQFLNEKSLLGDVTREDVVDRVHRAILK